jgi:hypothetical protein
LVVAAEEFFPASAWRRSWRVQGPRGGREDGDATRRRPRHEGIALRELGPDPTALVKTPNGTVLKVGDPVITYVARNLEPYRGFHIFMRALDEKMLREVTVDATRTHFMGRVPREVFIRAMQVSAAYVYLTYPFVLGWSLLEAMACGAPIVASDTAPVREALSETSARLFDFHQDRVLTELVLSDLGGGESNDERSRQARETAVRFDQAHGQAQYDLLLGRRPASSRLGRRHHRDVDDRQRTRQRLHDIDVGLSRGDRPHHAAQGRYGHDARHDGFPLNQIVHPHLAAAVESGRHDDGDEFVDRQA